MPPRSPVRIGEQDGVSLLEVLVVASVTAILAAVAIPQVLSSVDTSRARAAAHFLVSRMAMARAQAVSRAANVGLRFVETTDGVTVTSYQDGDRDGVRLDDIDASVDPVLEATARLSDHFPGVTVAFSGGAGPHEAPVPGRSRLFAFSPSSTATSGSLYIRARDGTQWAVRVLGITARVRVLKYIASTDEWVEVD